MSVSIAIIGLVSTAFVFSTALTWLTRRYAVHRLVDFPNDRSSHTVPTPRGGGLAIALVMAIAIGLIGCSQTHLISNALLLAMLGGGGVIALVGWVDDHGYVSPAWRSLVHVVGTIWAVYWLEGMHSVDLGVMAFSVGWIGSFLAVLGIVWCTNLYNFMDGIDGFAGVEAITVGVAAGVLLWMGGAPGLAIVAWLIAAASAGFLVWNWPPAKIFMGDVGSGFLGFVFGALALAGEKSGAMPALVWVTLLGVFVCDATFTLVYRVYKGERWYTAHRCHAYQRLVQMGWSHRRVMLSVLAVNLGMLGPLAWMSWRYRFLLPWCVGAVGVVGWFMWWKIQRMYAASVVKPEVNRA